MPDPDLSVLNTTGTDLEVIGSIWGDLEKSSDNSDSTSVLPTFVNSLILEVTVDNPPADFKLKLMMRPKVSIVSNSNLE